MPLIRGHHSFDNHFTQIPNAWVRDNRISFKARGLLVLLMSHTPGWNMSIRSIARANGTGIDTVKSAVMELEAAGYLVRSDEQRREDDGTFADYVWTTADPFQNPVTEKPVHGKLDTKNNNIKEQQDLENNERTLAHLKASEIDSMFSKFWEVYPRKTAKMAARRAFVKAVGEVGAEVIIEGARRYASDRFLPVKQFIPYPATWLNAGSWDDEPLPERELTPEEKAKIAQERSERDRIRAIAEGERRMREAEENRKNATPPPKCEHGNTIVSCRICLNRNSR